MFKSLTKTYFLMNIGDSSENGEDVVTVDALASILYVYLTPPLYNLLLRVDW